MDQKSKEAAIRSLMANEGWNQVMKPQIELMIKGIEHELFRVHLDYNKVQYTNHDLLRMVRLYLVKMQEIPYDIIKTSGVGDINDQMQEMTEQLIESYE